MLDSTNKLSTIPEVTIEEVNRVLEVGRMLLSVLTEEEIEELQEILSRQEADQNIGNAGVT
jgi:hypothetical protein